MDTIWLYENGTYIALALVQKTYLGKTLAEVADAQQREKVERIDWEKQELQAQLDLMSDALMRGNASAASIGGGNSFSVIGVSGLGKSTALQRVLSLFPQVIEHTQYHGHYGKKAIMYPTFQTLIVQRQKL